MTIFSKNRKNFLKRRLRRRFPALRAGNLAIDPPPEAKIVQLNPPQKFSESTDPPESITGIPAFNPIRGGGGQI